MQLLLLLQYFLTTSVFHKTFNNTPETVLFGNMNIYIHISKQNCFWSIIESLMKDRCG